MTLPHDGFPRITLEGIRLLKQGMAGDFEGWLTIPANHPREIPAEEVSNCSISADPETMHFIVTAWHGMEYPKLHGIGMAPAVEFDKLDLKESYTPLPDTIFLTSGRKPWGWRTGVSIAVESRGIGTADTTIYKSLAKQATLEGF